MDKRYPDLWKWKWNTITCGNGHEIPYTCRDGLRFPILWKLTSDAFSCGNGPCRKVPEPVKMDRYPKLWKWTRGPFTCRDGQRFPILWKLTVFRCRNGYKRCHNLWKGKEVLTAVKLDKRYPITLSCGNGEREVPYHVEKEPYRVEINKRYPVIWKWTRGTHGLPRQSASASQSSFFWQ